jgi:hypothetical protein
MVVVWSVKVGKVRIVNFRCAYVVVVTVVVVAWSSD